MKDKESIIYNEKPRKTRKGFIILIAIGAFIFTILPFVLMVVFMVNMEDTFSYNDFDSSNEKTIIANKKITIDKDIKGYYDSEKGIYYIEGILENTYRSDLDYISVDFTVYDIDGYILGTASTNINNLRKGAKWKFKAIYDFEDANEINDFEISRVYTF